MDVLYVNIKIAEIQSHNLIADPYDLPDLLNDRAVFVCRRPQNKVL